MAVLLLSGEEGGVSAELVAAAGGGKGALVVQAVKMKRAAQMDNREQPQAMMGFGFIGFFLFVDCPF
jgi:hypothetical protein